MKSAFCCPKPLIFPRFKLGNLAEGEGVEPSIPCGIRAFQARALGHYATPPMLINNSINRKKGNEEKIR